jgi:hypothetical protein
MRNDQDVREQDRGIEAEPPDWLQRDVDGELGREAEIEEARNLGPHRAIFRQIAAGLPHQPDRRNRVYVPRQRSDNLRLGQGRHRSTVFLKTQS